jgi:hypothetical protein
MLGICRIAVAQTPASAATQPATDAIAQALTLAKAQHRQAIDDAKKALLGVIDQRINAAADAGDLTLVQSLQVVKATAAVDGTVSDNEKDFVILIAKNHYDTSIGAARAKLNRAYQIAVRDYTRERNFTAAQSTQEELNSLVLVDPTMTPHVIDLLRLVDPTRDCVSGRWSFADGKLSNESSNGAQIRFPYQPPPEYDYHVVYDREVTNWGVALGVCRLADDMFGCGMPCQEHPESADVDGLQGMDSIRYRAPADAVTHCDVCVQVRNDHLTVIINGEKSVDQPMATWEFSKTPEWFSGPRSGLSLIDWYGRTTITKAEVTEISGSGQVLDGAVSK